MPEVEIIQAKIDRPKMEVESEMSLPEILWRCSEGSSLILETPHRRQAWTVVDGQWRCLGDIHKEVF